MSRRDILNGIFADTKRELAAANFSTETDAGRVLAGPVKTMGLALDRMDQEARELQEALKSGERVIELDPEFIDGSFVRDRLDGEVTAADDLVRSIEENGQEVPILVRQHPDLEGRYQVAYGHRRLRAVRLLKRKVRAVVRPLSDNELVVAQGIENTNRKDLSYIERAIFASSLETHGFGRDVIMQALSTDKTELSKLLSVAKGIPGGLVKAIGAAPSMGRRRWMDIAEKIADPKALEAAKNAIQKPEFEALGSDERFMFVLAEVSKKPQREQTVSEWRPNGGKVAAKIKDTGRAYTLSLKTAGADEGFGTYLTERLDDLYADWQANRQSKQE
ncbi:plasmid partitioning protein RepB [Mesorhizobium sp. P16.1]|uniref:plasmid partitioning protein RepB n=1 Tax=unclassified Mesorhizobium TaxID=325217 RepID=UPI0021A635EC|nr:MULTISPECIES: plasmid partitioning protein RepB [unclassified Mesorhizobium]MCT2580909.1 plasmid partitioning protein RepB [Mesorhizobium sp. P13.3]MDF3169952.1 plasmid partitioning protein RepB [Mesorhizobium sp. P16.1]MDF3181422.1 plasmid partitioning protein RepB [Mesorhizobium sp. P17.1]MDF3186911.1 plasmid partitioning protein RepB [Mesorhizobium sp. ICCV3110.1]